MASGPEYLLIQVLAVAGWQRFAFDDSKSASSVDLPLSPKEKSGIHLLMVEPLRKIKEMGNEEDLDACFEKCANDLPGDLGAFPLIC